MNTRRGQADGAEVPGIVAIGGVPKPWTADPQLMDGLTGMGISVVAAKKALYYTDNQSIELATNWIFENPDIDLDTPLELEVSNVGQSTGVTAGAEVFKMVFIVNSSLEMGVGKIAAQVAHAALGMHQILLQDETQFGESLIRWFEFGETKIVLKGENTQHLIDLERHALASGLPTYLVEDAGKTQVNAGSTTVLCIYGQTDRVDTVSGRLRLL